MQKKIISLGKTNFGLCETTDHTRIRNWSLERMVCGWTSESQGRKGPRGHWERKVSSVPASGLRFILQFDYTILLGNLYTAVQLKMTVTPINMVRSSKCYDSTGIKRVFTEEQSEQRENNMAVEGLERWREQKCLKYRRKVSSPHGSPAYSAIKSCLMLWLICNFFLSRLIWQPTVTWLVN